MGSKRSLWLLLVAIVLCMGLSLPCLAMPSFARKTDLACSACHSVWPALNDYGRKFKENGYRVDPGTDAPANVEEIDSRLFLDKFTLVSTRLKGYAYDKKDTDAEWKLKPGHELELYVAGNASNNFSFFGELEAEDDAGYGVSVEVLAAGWHPRPEANVVVAFAPLFWTDPYNTFSEGGRRLTRSHKAPLDTGFVVGEKLRKSTHQITFFGRAAGLYYSATLSSGAGDTSGADEKDATVRFAYDLPVVTFGGFYHDGQKTLGPMTTQNFERLGFDFQVETGPFLAYGLWLDATDDAFTGLMKTGEESNSAAYVEAMYIVSRDDAPFFAPLVRWETTEMMDGTLSTDAVAVALSTWVRSNVNLVLEHWKQTSVPTGAMKNDRTTLMFNVVL